MRALPVWFTLEDYQKARIRVYFSGGYPSVQPPARRLPLSADSALTSEDSETHEQGDTDARKLLKDMRDVSDEPWLLSESDPWLWDAESEITKKPKIFQTPPEVSP